MNQEVRSERKEEDDEPQLWQSDKDKFVVSTDALTFMQKCPL